MKNDSLIYNEIMNNDLKEPMDPALTKVMHSIQTNEESMDHGLAELIIKINENLALTKDTVIDYLNNALEHLHHEGKQAGLAPEEMHMPNDASNRFKSIMTVKKTDSDVDRLRTMHKGLLLVEKTIKERCEHKGLSFDNYTRLPLSYNLQTLLENAPTNVQHAEIVATSFPTKTVNAI